MNGKTHDTRQHILDVGYQLVLQKGFTGMGLSELLKTADVPKGSFYHYFASKEQLGVVLVEQYFQRHLSFMLQIFQQSNLSQFEKLMQYWQAWVEHNSPQCANGKCLVVKLAGEVSDFSEPMRMALLTGTEQVITHLTTALSEGCQQGEFHLSDSRQTAELLYNMWLGASLLVKIRLDDSTLQHALQTTEQLLTQPQR
ncbi:TetR family transcriptional regulator [Shewanella mangrovi]|uniref:TetR family transcriptional regulator n=1 Tax=Shewanella mangrovi TaxID=1515746 RepID=A0A094JIW0_9GAMM|nr:TetR/AcrR family transcriptional regulator [Shewanella mangrovi]KFZ37989.1 TetR family transcriptional regulator [Shewanella mangrovi]